MTDEQIAEIRKRLEAATPGPWKSDIIDNVGGNWLIGFVLDAGIDQENKKWIVTTDNLRASECVSGGAEEDTQFIAHAPTDISALLADNDRLRGELDVMARLYLQTPGSRP